MLKKISDDQLIDELIKREATSRIVSHIDVSSIMDHLATRDGVEDQVLTNKNIRVLTYVLDDEFPINLKEV